ncbi:phosphate signaling complex protein PhoU [Cytobacillus sp. S13-E01]|uniref:phosphate signaling complex protein PhoU n=1 Tax=Cytobacillus sp. S13-E01 TaxID=3031326 RepID=UPI0023D7DCD6|nr:phosphate signaling complex protein PhoU [Cytobacillus sp. S13-E01]MDF0727173.1 phosphate signaling complex protein PhoU [Cytobacillus sp. S13-E01]
MAIRSSFDKDLKRLKDDLLEMVTLAKNSVEDSVKALADLDFEKAKQIIEDDEKINRYDEKINNLVVQLIAQQQPVATDLRRIIAALKISNDVERIGDLAVNISKSILHIGNGPLIKPIVEIPKMANMALEMLTSVIEAYINEDPVLAKETAASDDQVDALYGKLTQELLELMAKNPQYIHQVTQLAFVCRYIERIADHTTNMSEHIIFMVKAKTYELNT